MSSSKSAPHKVFSSREMARENLKKEAPLEQDQNAFSQEEIDCLRRGSGNGASRTSSNGEELEEKGDRDEVGEEKQAAEEEEDRIWVLEEEAEQPKVRREMSVSVSSSSVEDGERNNNCQQTSETSKRASRLKRATRAILLFRRAAVANRTANNGRTDGAHEWSEYAATASGRQHRASVGRVHQLAASFASFWRQNAAHHNSDSSLASVQQHCRERRPARWPTLASSRSSNLAEHQEDSNHHLGNSSDSNTCLPRFIVPKMNALKLPIVCLIKSLDGQLMREIFVHRYELGQYIVDNLKVSLDIKDAKYFGLRMASSLDDQENVKQPWLDLNESVCKQISKFSGSSGFKMTMLGAGNNADNNNNNGVTRMANLKAVEFYLRIKYYPPNLARVQDSFLKQYLFMQLRRDLRLGKLTSSMNNLTLLMAYILQYELGDYKPELVSERLSEMNILPNQDMIEQQAIDIWKHRLAGFKRHQTQMQFLRASVILETYGFDYYPVRDHQRQRGYLLGFNYAGVKTIRNGRIVHHFRWHSISKISYERRMIIFHIYPNENSKRKQILGFKCLSNEECQNLYMRLLEQKYFFTVDLAYFDKSIRRPSYLTESVGNSSPGDQVEWPPPMAEREQQQGRRQLSSETTSTATNENGDNQQQCYGEGEQEERAAGLLETNPEHNRDEESEPCRGSNGLAHIKSGQLRTSHQSHSFDSTQLASGAQNGQINSTIPTYDDCPDCKRAQQPLAATGLNAFQQQRQSQYTQCLNAALVPPLTKSSSLQEPNQSQAARPIPTLHYPTSSLCSVGMADCSFESSSSDKQSIRSPTSLCAKLGPQTEPLIMKSNHRASLQRQRSTWTNSPTPTGSPPSPPVVEYTIGAPTVDPIQDEQPAVDNHVVSTRLAEWLEWIFIHPMIRVGCWSPMSNIDSSVATSSTSSSSPTRYLFAQAIRFCLLIVLMNFLVRLSDCISGSLVDLLTFRTYHHRDNQASHCIWSTSQPDPLP